MYILISPSIYLMATKKELDGNAADIQSSTTPKRRARIVKKDTDHVYSATQDQGERFDSAADERTHKRAAAAIAKGEKAAAIHALESEVLAPPKKPRGRPSKAYLEAQRAYEEALSRRQSELAEAKAALASNGRATESKTTDEVEEPASTVEVAIASQEPEIAQDDDDVPEFIKMQQTATITEKDTEVDAEIEQKLENVVAAIAENSSKTANNTESQFETGGAEIDSVENEAENVELRMLRDAYADGRRFIIIEDIPRIDAEGYSFVVQEDEYEPVRFRKFKEDLAMNPQVAAPIVAKNEEEDNVKPEEKAQPAIRLGEITIESEGVMDIDNQGVGYLRSADYNYMSSPDDIFVSQNQIRSYSLKTGDLVNCIVRVPREGEKYFALKEVISINGYAPHQVRDRIAFEHLTPLFPDEQFKLAKRGEKSPLTCRIVDLFAPIGKGQRALIVAQPKTGKTILMKQIANAIAANYPDTYLIMLLIDERPEEVTDMARTVNAEVIASTFDEPAKRHVRIANIVLEKAKRMVECGRDVVIFLDSITRLARAFNTEAPASGKILTGGVDANALQKPKRFFGAARNIEGGGSLTIIATALTDTGSKMDEVIFEEFKGTGNMELQLDRNLANKRIFPAVNLVQSSTRREDLLLDETTVNRMFITRNYMADMNPVEAMNFLRRQLDPTISNEEFIASIGTK